MAKTIPNSKKLKSLHDYFFQSPGWANDDNTYIPINYTDTCRVLQLLDPHDLHIIQLTFHTQSTNKFNSDITSQFFYQFSPTINLNLFWITCYLHLNPKSLYTSPEEQKSKITKSIIKENKDWMKSKEISIKLVKSTLNNYYSVYDQYILAQSNPYYLFP